MSIEADFIDRAAAINCIANHACMNCKGDECGDCPHKEDIKILYAIPAADVKLNNINPNAFEGAWYDNYCKSLQSHIDGAEENLQSEIGDNCFQKGFIQGLKVAQELFSIADKFLCRMIPVTTYNNGFANKFECTNCKAHVYIQGFMKEYPFNRCTECGTKVLKGYVKKMKTYDETIESIFAKGDAIMDKYVKKCGK